MSSIGDIVESIAVDALGDGIKALASFLVEKLTGEKDDSAAERVAKQAIAQAVKMAAAEAERKLGNQALVKALAELGETVRNLPPIPTTAPPYLSEEARDRIEVEILEPDWSTLKPGFPFGDGDKETP